MNVSKKIIAVFSCIAIIISCMVFPASASGGVSGAVQTFFEWSVKSGEDVVNGFWKVIYGDDWRSADRERLQSAYTTYVTDLQSDLGSTILSNGGVLIPFTVRDFSVSNATRVDDPVIGSSYVSGSFKASQNSGYLYVQLKSISVPFAGYVSTGAFTSFSNCHFEQSFLSNSSVTKGSYVSLSRLGNINDGVVFYPNDYNDFSSFNCCFYAVLTPLEDNSLPTTQDITINSRPTSITGDYGILGDNGTITKVDGNVIVDESSSTVYNPVTNTTTNFTSWAYDYSDRSYNLTTEAGDTITVTYGDENITINEGDTVYNVYYLVESEPEGGGGSGGSGSGDTHTHTYTDEVTKQPSCLLSGVRTYTCSCGDSYTKTISATGHDWQITQQVPNSYDPETGEQTQSGYTVYACATCGEQYKSTDGQAPPNGSTGDSEKETIWDKIGNLFGTIGNGFLGIIDAIVGKLLDGLISLAETISTKLKSVVEMVLSWFDEIPALFGGFLSFLGALFPFLPDECIMLLEFGLAAVIFIAIINLLRRR